MAVLSTFLSAIALPAAAQAASCPTGVAADAAPVAETELAAQKLAALCDKPVEVNEAADEVTKTVALPNGNFRFESYVEPQRVERGSRWVDLDTNLERGGDGRFRPRTAADVSFSAGGDGPFAVYKQGGAEFTLSWPRTLPAPAVDGDAATYPEVYAGVDLVVRAVAGGFSHVLVVKTPAAAANPAVRSASYEIGGTAKVTESNGEIRIAGPKGVVARAPQAIAWDSSRRPPQPKLALRKADPDLSSSVAATASSAEAPGEHARHAGLDVSVSGRKLKVAIDERLLAGKPVFPIYIDPVFQPSGYQKWIPVSKLSPGTSWVSGTAWPREVIRVGSNWENTADIWRAHLQFNITSLKDKRIIKTPSVDAVVNHSALCAGEKLSIWQTNTLDGNTPTWNGMSSKWLHGAALQTKTVKANSACSGQGPSGVKFNAAGVKNHVQRHANASYTSITFGLRVPAENSGHWVKIKRDSVVLNLEYQHRPANPEPTRTAPGGGCAASPGPWINDSTPALYGKATDGDGTVKVVFDLTGPTSPADYTTGFVGSGKEGGWTVGTALADGAYQWRVSGTDGVAADNTDWSKYCYFRQDHTPPTLPVITRTSTGAPEIDKPVTLKFSSTDGSGSGVRQFEYGVGVDAQQTTVAAGSGQASMTFTPSSGRTQVYVWARDNALNLSTRAVYNVFTGRVTPIEPRGLWRMTHDPRDDSGTIDVDGTKSDTSSVKDLTWTSTGLAYGTDRNGKGGAALNFTDGSGCASTVPVVRGDHELTVAAWVKLGAKSSNRAVVALIGDNAPSLVLAYQASTDRWETAITGTDDTAATWTVARGTTSPELNTWTHLAAGLDPVGKVLRLFVNGKIAAETPLTSVPWHAGVRTRIGCGGTASAEHTPWIGSIDQVGIWSGLLSETQVAAVANELPAGVVAQYELRGTGEDRTGNNYGLTIPSPPAPEPSPEPTPEPTDEPVEEEPVEEEPSPDPTADPEPTETAPEWVDDAYGRPESAWQVTGDRCATTSGAAIATDESFSVAAWVKVTDGSHPVQTVVAQSGNQISGFYLGGRDGVWALHLKQADNDSSTAYNATSSAGSFTASVGRWTHLAGVFHASDKTMALYVDGKLASRITSPPSRWHAPGALTVGCGKFGGVLTDHVRGAITDVRVWRGALTDAEALAVKAANAPITLEGMWPLEGPRADEPTSLEDRSGHSRHLTVDGDYTWSRDRFESRDGALGLDLAEGSCARTGGPVLRTDGSFTVAAWVSLDDLTGTRTVVAQSGAVRQGFRLEYFGEANRWRFVMPQSDADGVALVEIRSDTAPVAGTWTHLAAVYDLPAKTVRLYVNGVAQGGENGGVPAPAAPWQAPGQLTVGCAGTTGGNRANYLGGLVDDVRVWTSTVDADLFDTFAHA